MLSPRTDRKLAEGLKRLAADQAAGAAPPAGEITRADIARRAGVSEGTIANIEATFRARLAVEILSDPAAPNNLITLARRVLSKL